MLTTSCKSIGPLIVIDLQWTNEIKANRYIKFSTVKKYIILNILSAYKYVYEKVKFSKNEYLYIEKNIFKAPKKAIRVSSIQGCTVLVWTYQYYVYISSELLRGGHKFKNIRICSNIFPSTIFDTWLNHMHKHNFPFLCIDKFTNDP